MKPVNFLLIPICVTEDLNITKEMWRYKNIEKTKQQK